MTHKTIELTEEQRGVILLNYATMDLSTLAKLVFNNPQASSKTVEGLAIKYFLTGRGISSEGELLKAPKGPIGRVMLSDAQRKQIEELFSKISNILELSRIVWKDPNLKQMSKEYRAVFDYYKSIYPEGIDASEDLVEDLDFKPPTTMPALVGLVNECIPSGGQKRTYDWPLKRIGEERQLRALMGYLRVMLFKVNAAEYNKKVDRNLYISLFVRYTHDKPDLTPEEVDQYILASAETVNIVQINRDLRRINTSIEEVMNGDVESRGRFMPLVELLNTTRGKLDQSKGRLDTLIDGLVGSRSKRLKDRDTRNSSILNLFEAWTKDEQQRNDLIELGVQEHEEDKREIGRLKSIDDLSTLIAGQTEEEAWKG